MARQQRLSTGPSSSRSCLHRIELPALLATLLSSSLWGDVSMSTIIQILALWTLVSCVLGPLLTWAFFWSERNEREGRRIDASRQGAYANRWATSRGLRAPS